MKASIKFREDQKPLFRAKVPLNVMGLQFQSGVVAGESKELSLNLGTFFDSGPSVKIAYRPNDSLNPFSLVFKTGIGHFGSPISSPMIMSADFNLIGDRNPTFFVHFKPRFGDFCLKKSQSSDFVKSIKSKVNGVASGEDGSSEVIETPRAVKDGFFTENGPFSSRKIAPFPSESATASFIAALFSGAQASAKTALPMMNRAVLNFRWGFRFPAAEELAVARRNSTSRISFQYFPLLVMNKIGIEHVAEEESKDSKKIPPISKSPVRTSIAETCLAMQHQLELIQAENGMLRQAVDDLRSEYLAGKPLYPTPDNGADLGRYRGEKGAKSSGGRDDRRSNGDKKSSEPNGLDAKATEG